MKKVPPKRNLAPRTGRGCSVQRCGRQSGAWSAQSKMPALTYVYGASLAIGGIFAYQGQWQIGMCVVSAHACALLAGTACALRE